MLARVRRAFPAKATPPDGRGYGTEIPAVPPALAPGGCAAGVIMADGTIVRPEGEPPTAKGGNWFHPATTS
jgi:hypothetical protein